MATVYFKFYGGTGALIARPLVNLMMVNPLIHGTDATGHSKPTTTVDEAKIRISLMDYDQPTVDGGESDYKSIVNLIHSYQALHSFGMKWIAATPIYHDMVALSDIRNRVFGNMATGEYDVRDVFAEATATLQEALLTEEQCSAANRNGCYADLARNALIANPIQHSSGFSHPQLEAYDIVFYCGSTDGGTANVYLDYDMCSLIDTQQNGDVNRPYRVYSVRTLPYKRIPHASRPGTSQEEVIKNETQAEKNNNNLIPKSVGVLQHILEKSVARKPYVKSGNQEVPYYLDGLYLIGSQATDQNTLVVTDYEPYYKPDCQHHRNHPTEVGAALAMLDAVWCLPQPPANDRLAIYGYHDDSNAAKIALSDNVFSLNGNNVTMENRIKAFLKLLTVVKCHLLPDLKWVNAQYARAGNRGIDNLSVASDVLLAHLVSARHHSFISGDTYSLSNYPKFNAKGRAKTDGSQLELNNYDANGVQAPGAAELFQGMARHLQAFLDDSKSFVKMFSEAMPKFLDSTPWSGLLNDDVATYHYDSASVLSAGQNGEHYDNFVHSIIGDQQLAATGTGGSVLYTEIVSKYSNLVTEADRIAKSVCARLLDLFYEKLI